MSGDGESSTGLDSLAVKWRFIQVGAAWLYMKQMTDNAQDRHDRGEIYGFTCSKIGGAALLAMSHIRTYVPSVKPVSHFETIAVIPAGEIWEDGTLRSAFEGKIGAAAVMKLLAKAVVEAARESFVIGQIQRRRI